MADRILSVDLDTMLPPQSVLDALADVLGSTGDTATWDTLPGKPAVIAAGTDAAAARTVIGASLQI